MNNRHRPSDAADRPLAKPSLDKDLTRIASVEEAARPIAHRLAALGIAICFLGLAGAYASIQAGAVPNAALIIVASILGGYMALNIGANDVANNVAPAVGSRALTLVGALAIAAVFEAAGALIAGGDVVATVSRGIIDPGRLPDTQVFVWAMMSALLAAALWINLATYIGAPVSTTHAVIGAVMGSGIAAAGFDLVNWGTMGAIAASWVISPALGGIIAAIFLAFIKINIIYQDDKIAAAKRWIPVLLALMAAAFSCYLVMKGAGSIWRPGTLTIIAIGGIIYTAAFLPLRKWIAIRAVGLENRNQSLRQLFHLPLICSAALLSFAHGANDVANAVGPLAAIVHSVTAGGVETAVEIPAWVLLTGAAGISLGLFLYGPRLVRIVGEQITRMNPMRAFCVALSAAITVIIASGLGLPVSSTHTAVGAIFGVGFFREYYTARSTRRRQYISARGNAKAGERSGYAQPDDIQNRKLVRRVHFLTIIAAWLITVPAAALLSAGLYAFFHLLR